MTPTAPSRPKRTTARTRFGGVAALVAVLLVLVTAVAVALREPGAPDTPGAGSTQDFLDVYVDDGRVVRLDQGGDTVSEGQAYAMLIAVGSGDRETFDEVWTWTQDNLLRDDGLLSWRWEDGELRDPSSAADADLDAARALLLASQQWGEPSYQEDALRLGEAILDHETVAVPAGRVLTAGTWTVEDNDDGPWVFNPSYVSPVATTMLGAASGDHRWAEVEAGGRAAVDALVDTATLPPDWAEIDASGAVAATSAPDGTQPQFSYDAARTLVRQAEACGEADRTIAREAGEALGDAPAVAVYDLGGAPLTDDRSPLSLVAQAAGEAVAGAEDDARNALGEAEQAGLDYPSYYGDAWAVLGPMLLTSDVLGSCPPLGPD